MGAELNNQNLGSELLKIGEKGRQYGTEVDQRELSADFNYIFDSWNSVWAQPETPKDRKDAL